MTKWTEAPANYHARDMNRFVFVAQIATVTAALLAAEGTAAHAEVCHDMQTYVEVDVASEKLFLCNANHVVRTFRVSLGRGGLDKKVTGDARTPIGKYALGTPRPSDRFVTFIPIGYPTAEQKKQGLTGTDVGVHGPLNYLSRIGRLNTLINWTNGCIAVGTAEEIADVAAWVSLNHVDTIVIR